jgi:hypothetical protein
VAAHDLATIAAEPRHEDDYRPGGHRSTASTARGARELRGAAGRGEGDERETEHDERSESERTGNRHGERLRWKGGIDQACVP